MEERGISHLDDLGVAEVIIIVRTAKAAPIADAPAVAEPAVAARVADLGGD